MTDSWEERTVGRNWACACNRVSSSPFRLRDETGEKCVSVCVPWSLDSSLSETLSRRSRSTLYSLSEAMYQIKAFELEDPSIAADTAKLMRAITGDMSDFA